MNNTCKCHDFIVLGSYTLFNEIYFPEKWLSYQLSMSISSRLGSFAIPTTVKLGHKFHSTWTQINSSWTCCTALTGFSFFRFIGFWSFNTYPTSSRLKVIENLSSILQKDVIVEFKSSFCHCQTVLSSELVPYRPSLLRLGVVSQPWTVLP